jgi:hypothetical protein
MSPGSVMYTSVYEFYKTVCELQRLVIKTINIAGEQPSEMERMPPAFNTGTMKNFMLIWATFETGAIF